MASVSQKAKDALAALKAENARTRPFVEAVEAAKLTGNATAIRNATNAVRREMNLPLLSEV